MPENKSQRWCIYIDLLGFSALWDSKQKREQERMKALNSLRELMRAIYRIGTCIYPTESKRLFVHQMGDGFAIVNDFAEPSLERPIAIAIALMRCVATTGTFAAAAIAEGELADITGCYPAEVTKDSEDTHMVRLGAGLMTLSSVMGTAFIRAYRLHNDLPPGPFLMLAGDRRDQIPVSVPVRPFKSRKGVHLLSIDWIRSDTALLTKIQKKASPSASTPGALVQAVRGYGVEYDFVPEKWGAPLRELLDIER